MSRMSRISKIHKDDIGLFTVCGGWVSRPVYGTSFNEGDDVKTHHFGGSSFAGVTSPDKPDTHHFKKNGKYEVWSTTGISYTEYKNKKIFPKFGQSNLNFEDYLREKTKWYYENSKGIGQFYVEENLKFKK